MALWPNCRAFATAMPETPVSVLDCWEVLVQATPEGHKKGIGSLFILVCHSIWRERNSRVFNDKSMHHRQLAVIIREEAQEWAFAGAKALRRLLWEPP